MLLKKKENEKKIGLEGVRVSGAHGTLVPSSFSEYAVVRVSRCEDGWMTSRGDRRPDRCPKREVSLGIVIPWIPWKIFCDVGVRSARGVSDTATNNKFQGVCHTFNAIGSQVGKYNRIGMSLIAPQRRGRINW